jgi:hypothetical protein
LFSNIIINLIGEIKNRKKKGTPKYLIRLELYSPKYSLLEPDAKRKKEKEFASCNHDFHVFVHSPTN